MAIYYAYKNFKGKRANGTMVYGIIPQFDGTRYAGFNCGGACEAMRDVSQQKGVRPAKGSPWQPTGWAIRNTTGDTSGGMNPYQTTQATRTRYGISTASPRIASKAGITDKLKAGYGIDLLVSYGPINNYKSGSPGFTGNHRIMIVGIDTGTNRLLSADPLYDGRRSGIPLGPKWIPRSIIWDAASRLDLGGGVRLYSRYGWDDAYYIPTLTRLVTKRYKAVVPAGSFMAYTVKDGRITGRTAKKTGGFSATCTAPLTYYWPNHGYFKLVKLTSGSREGMYINAKYAKEI